ncbi:MAG TPA: alpha/beta fold hydrolase [Candidatus Binatia bacterium]|jgi:polyhydroxyalkanoate synthase|nr:alpha/beta fold hydrolase [Candidatus Binatia bacterium]
MKAQDNSFLRSWLQGPTRALQDFARSLPDPFPLSEDLPAVTPFKVIYQGGKLRLRHYPTTGTPHAPPLLIVYALFKRPFILDLQAGHSVVENFTAQGFDIYLTDWIPPTQADSGRGFEAYVNGDIAKAVRVVQARTHTQQVSLFGFSFGGLLAAIYTALHPETVKHLVTLGLPVDTSVPKIGLYSLLTKLSPTMIDLLTATYGNCPAWLVKAGIESPTLIRRGLTQSARLCQNGELADYLRLCARLTRWFVSDVPLAGQMAREMTHEILQRNLFARNRLVVGGKPVNLKGITCPVLNLIGTYDDLVPPQSSSPFLDLIGSNDARNLFFPTSHIGTIISCTAQTRLWPQVGTWLRQRAVR